MAFGDDVHNRVKRIDATMLSLVNTLRKFGVPKGLGAPLNNTRNAVGDLVAKMEMTQRRS
ncbi:hypothetical protein SAMN05421805_10386 [Saccharopolyspora antimicrobica]|uniref:Uncharacterized protein n=1 Tax=Saccharopolyspora antimicrobica TaxID=455193 RepID=A0A1I4WUL9_9PSEU|nr:hypothetical protein [Saccharopolyspora antimicrobica]RKT82941.1 hypothetical protein ATL45_1204 [Saccharopolyspora antimicrobica]SFN17508.1 hypothetical protein SAMN05421805_10386 [Saccharopolyspora antimicrobica]